MTYTEAGDFCASAGGKLYEPVDPTTESIVRGYVFSMIRAIRLFGGQRNSTWIGMDNLNNAGRYIVFLCPDTLVLEKYHVLLHNVMEQNPVLQGPLYFKYHCTSSTIVLQVPPDYKGINCV